MGCFLIFEPSGNRLQPLSDAPGRRYPPTCAAQIVRPGKRSRVRSKIRCDGKFVVSSGLPMTLVRPPLPPCVCVKTRQPRSFAFFQNGSNLGLESSSLLTLAADGSAHQMVLLDGFF